jgi:hypothetical protein
MPDQSNLGRRLPAAAAGLFAACCTVHLTLLFLGVGTLLAATAGATVVAAGTALIGAGLRWSHRRRSRSASR